MFFVEVMGDDAGFLALNGALSAGCEEAIIPGINLNEEEFLQSIKQGIKKKKSSSIVLVAANDTHGGAMHYAELVKNDDPSLDVRISILGHLQRGGHPSAHDRIIASRMGSASIHALKKGLRNVMVGIANDEIVYVPFSKVIRENRQINRNLLEILHNIS